MISARPDARDGFAKRLADKARKLAAAHAENRLRAARGEAGRWRKARLLWPLQHGSKR